MRLRHATPEELTREARRGGARWSAAVCRRLLALAADASSRVLVAEEEGRLRAVLGLAMDRCHDGGERRARIVELAVDPAHSQRDIGSRLVRFAEGIALIEGCRRVEVDPRIQAWGDGRCWPSLGYAAPAGLGIFKPLGRRAAGCRA